MNQSHVSVLSDCLFVCLPEWLTKKEGKKSGLSRREWERKPGVFLQL